MKFIKLIIFLIVSLVFTSLVSAVTIESYMHSVELTGKDSTHTIEGIILIEEKTEQFNLTLIPRVENLKVFIDGQKRDCDLDEKVGFSILDCPIPNDIIGKHFFKVSFSSNYPLFEVGNKVLFKSEYNPMVKTETFNYVVRLPKGYVVPEEEGKDVSFFINPNPKNIYSDGQRIILSWEETNLDKKFEVSVFIEKLAISITNLVLLLGSFLAIFLAISYYFLRKRKKETHIPNLLEKERKIVEALKKAKNNELWQKQLQIETKFSKARLSRTLRDLKIRGIIKKEPIGNTNKISLIAEEEHKKVEDRKKEETNSELMQENFTKL